MLQIPCPTVLIYLVNELAYKQKEQLAHVMTLNGLLKFAKTPV